MRGGLGGLGDVLGLDEALELGIGHGELDLAARTCGDLAHLGHDDQRLVREIPGVGVVHALGEALDVKELLGVLLGRGEDVLRERRTQFLGLVRQVVEGELLAGDCAEVLTEVVIAPVGAAV